MSSEDSVLEQILSVVRSLDGLPAELAGRIDGTTSIVRDLKLDSIAVMDFIMALETKFDTIIPIDSVARIETVRDLAQLLQTRSARAFEARPAQATR